MKVAGFAVAVVLAGFAAPVLAEDWVIPPENAERCANNLARYTALTTEIDALPRMSTQDLSRARGKLHEVELINAGSEALSTETKAMFAALSAEYKYNWLGCVTQDMSACTAGLATHIRDLVERADQADLDYKRLTNERQKYDTNLIALSCVPSVFTIAGTYESNWGTMVLSGEGSVTGTFAYQNGRLQGTVTGTVFTGYWSQTESGQKCDSTQLGTSYWGRVVLGFTRDARSFAGRWGYCDGPTDKSDWYGQK